MAQLIQMRQRIKAIETIKKITHAMRLIAMSNHNRLKGKEQTLVNYSNSLNNLFVSIKQHAPDWSNPILYPAHAAEQKPLIVLVASSKGLAGGFNAATFKMFDLHVPLKTRAQFNYISVGKKATEHLTNHVPNTAIVATYNDFSSANLLSLATTLTDTLLTASPAYSSVIFFSSKQKSFFSQKPYRLQLIPFTTPEQDLPLLDLQEYIWEQSPTAMLDLLARQCIEASLQKILFQSLLAEQAARFLSMDSSTRNANTLLEVTQLQYNKLRQAKITRELTELTSSV